jgi:hypothetical protein
MEWLIEKRGKAEVEVKWHTTVGKIKRNKELD